MTRCVLFLLLLATAFFMTPAARGDAGEAAEIFRRGEAAAARGEYLVAARLFEEAFEASPHPVAIYSAAIVWEKAGEPARAADAYAKALTFSGMAPRARAEARARLAALELSVGTLEVDAPAGASVTVAHHKRRPPPLRIHLPPDNHRVMVVLHDGTTQEREVRVRAGTVTSLRIAAKKVAPPPAPEPPVTREFSPTFIVGWVAFGAATAAAGVAIGAGVMTLRERDEYLEVRGKADVATQENERNEAAALRTWTNVGWAATGALAIVGIVCVVVGWPRDDAEAVTLTPTGAAIRF